MLAEIGESGVKIKTRRKRNYIPLQKEIGLSFFSPKVICPTMSYYNNETHEKEFTFLTDKKPPLTRGKTYTMIIPSFATEDDEKEQMSQIALVNKIVLGTCAWLWGDEFILTEQASELRRRMREVKIENVLEMDSSDKHLELPDGPEGDALDNKPHHSILIGIMDNEGMENKLVGLVNLFGEFESMTIFGDSDHKFKRWLGNSGVVVIPKTTQNQVLKMTWEEYIKFKQKLIASHSKNLKR